MIDKRCKTCMWWDNKHARLENLPADKLETLGICRPGICRKHKPASAALEKLYYLGVQPIMDAEDVCGEHRPEKQ